MFDSCLLFKTDVTETCFSVDVTEEKNLKAVVICLTALGRAVQKKLPASPLPKLGIKETEKIERFFFSPEQLRGKGEEMEMCVAHELSSESTLLLHAQSGRIQETRYAHSHACRYKWSSSTSKATKAFMYAMGR